MKRKNGFTLIELLAVIVILAIIALIATPLVLKYIEKSRKESKVDSAYSFVRNLENEIANFAIKNNGKKYTTDKENIKELGLDITVKGENPEDGKVCISSVGQVEKAILQYGKYYVSYDGKKGSISDSDTYDNFSCSGNIAGDDDAIIYEGVISFNYETDKCSYDNCYYGSTSKGVNELIAKTESFKMYQLIIKDQNTNEIKVEKDMLGFLEDGYVGFQRGREQYIIVVYDGIMSLEIKDQLVGDYVVQIKELNIDYPSYVVRINENGQMWLLTEELISAQSVNFLISDDTKDYFNNNVTAGRSYWERDEFVDVYNALKDGKIITIKVTYIIDGNTVTQTFGGEAPISDEESADIMGNHEYYWGNPYIPCWE